MLRPAARRGAALAVAILAIALVCSAAAQAAQQVDETLTVFFSGNGTGKVTSNPPGISCNASCRATYAQGTTVTLTATPDAGSGIDSWSGGVCQEQGNLLSYKGTTCTVTMSQSRGVTVYFTKVQLSVYFSSNGKGTVTSAPPGIDCKENCTATYAPGTKVVLTAKPDPDSGFDTWSGGACAEQGNKTEYHGLVCTITLDGSKSVTAYFTKVNWAVFFSGEPGGGKVTSSPAGIDCDVNCTGTFPLGATVKLTAVPNAGFTVDSWSSGVCTEQGNKQTYNGTTCTATLSGGKSVTIYWKKGAAGGTIGSSSPPPPPKPGVAVNVESDSGTTLVKLPGSSTFQTLKGGAQVPVGSTVDATKGRMGLTSSGGASDFSKGAFVVREPKVAGARVTTLALTGGNFGACPKKVKRKTASFSAAAPKVVRQLVGNGKGRFRTSGRFAAATVRGTGWTIQDRCDGTLVKVTKGIVAVTNLKTHKVVVVRAGKSYLAPK